MATAKRTEALTDSERQSLVKAKLAAQGGRRVSLNIDGETAALLDAYLSARDMTQTEAICNAVRRQCRPRGLKGA